MESYFTEEDEKELERLGRMMVMSGLDRQGRMEFARLSGKCLKSYQELKEEVIHGNNRKY